MTAHWVMEHIEIYLRKMFFNDFTYSSFYNPMKLSCKNFRDTPVCDVERQFQHLL